MRFSVVVSKALILFTDQENDILHDALGATALIGCSVPPLALLFPGLINFLSSQAAIYMSIVLDLLFDAIATPHFPTFFASSILPRLALMSMAINFILLVLPPASLAHAARSNAWSVTTPIKEFWTTAWSNMREAALPNADAIQRDRQNRHQQHSLAMVDSDLLALQEKYKSSTGMFAAHVLYLTMICGLIKIKSRTIYLKQPSILVSFALASRESFNYFPSFGTCTFVRNTVCLLEKRTHTTYFGIYCTNLRTCPFCFSYFDSVYTHSYYEGKTWHIYCESYSKIEPNLGYYRLPENLASY